MGTRSFRLEQECPVKNRQTKIRQFFMYLVCICSITKSYFDFRSGSIFIWCGINAKRSRQLSNAALQLNEKFSGTGAEKAQTG